MNYTPGPWRIERNARLEIIYTVEPFQGVGWNQGIAHVYRQGKMNGTPYRMPAEANARLISAAPELVGVASAAMHLLRTYENGNASPDLAKSIADSIEQIIARVTGR